MNKLIFSAVLLGLTSMVYANTPKAKPQVEVEKAKLSKVNRTFLFPALVKSRIESNISADADLIVVKSHVSLGQRVTKGQILLEMRNQDTTMNYHNRLLKAPVAGVVAALMVSSGEYIQKGQQLALINDPQLIYLKLEMPLSHHAEVKPGLLAKGKTHLSEKNSFEAKVVGIGAVLDATTGTVPLELEFTAGAKNLLPGTIANIELILSEEQKLLIPEKALYYSGEKIFLPKLTNGNVKKSEVRIRTAAKGQVEILEGLTVGEDVIVGAGEFLKDGDIVDVLKK